jgi:hypothetical protein
VSTGAPAGARPAGVREQLLERKVGEPLELVAGALFRFLTAGLTAAAAELGEIELAGMKGAQAIGNSLLAAWGPAFVVARQLASGRLGASPLSPRTQDADGP